jgi:enoyl-CoA hydratase/carnithine racemase
MSDFVQSVTAGGITTITLNRADCGNLVSNAMGAEIAGMIDAAAGSRLIVLRGAGDDFCLGRDGAAMKAQGPLKTAIDVRRGNTEPALFVYSAFRRTTVPVLGVVQGRAIGFGCALAACAT